MNPSIALLARKRGKELPREDSPKACPIPVWLITMVRVLQLLPGTFGAESNSCDGIRIDGARLGS